MVELKTTIAQGLHVTDDSAGYDAACKRVLSEKAILARIMKSCLEEYKDCDVNDIAEKYIEGQPQVSAVPVLPDEGGTVISGMDTEDKSVREGTVTYDIRFRAIVPDSEEQIALIINVEAQNDFYPGYPLIKRGIYYCCRMISSQYGREFTGSHYEKIKKVYSIWICMKPPQYRENTITRYRLVEEYLVGEGKEPIICCPSSCCALAGRMGQIMTAYCGCWMCFSPTKPARRKSGKFCRTITTFK